MIFSSFSQVKQIEDRFRVTLEKFNQQCDRFQEKLDRVERERVRQGLNTSSDHQPSIGGHWQRSQIKIEEFDTMRVIIVDCQAIGSYQHTQKGWLAATVRQQHQYFGTATAAIGYILRCYEIGSHIGAVDRDVTPRESSF